RHRLRRCRAAASSGLPRTVTAGGRVCNLVAVATAPRMPGAALQCGHSRSTDSILGVDWRRDIAGCCGWLGTSVSDGCPSGRLRSCWRRNSRNARHCCWRRAPAGCPLGEELLTPTRIYVNQALLDYSRQMGTSCPYRVALTTRVGRGSSMTALVEELRSKGVQLVAMAGFMRIVTRYCWTPSPAEC
uniref:RibD_C domain-containing protein n=1 Tax=Macrostomum lignano TaxID=282301 RepID=A0A1I8FIT7_9PLAT